jgi:nucleotide-binding universal stress UspA family protein
MNKNQIYYPTDFSPCAQNALKYAMHLAKATKSDIEIIHEIDIHTGPSATMISKDAMGIVSMVEDEAKTKLAQIQENLKDEGVNSTTKIIFGSKLVEYLKNYESKQNSIIVMGTKGSSNAENRIFGSVTHKIIHEVSSPVLVVPIEAQFDGISEILFAADYSTIDKDQFNQLTNIGSYFHSTIHAVHVLETDSKEEDKNLAKDLEGKIRDLSDYPQLEFQMLYAKNIEERLQSMITEQDMNLLVLITKKRSFFERLFGQSLTKKMVYHTKIPMLVFQKK